MMTYRWRALIVLPCWYF